MVTDLNERFEMDTGLSSNNAGFWHARGEIILKGTNEHVASLLGEGTTIQSAERDLLFKARKYLKMDKERKTARG